MKEKNIRNYFVLTGGPGTGKTTILNNLIGKGYLCIAEIAREIIKDQVLKRGDALPWVNKAEYARLMWEESIKSYQSTILSKESEIIFFDRGILDTICYMEMEDLAIDETQQEFLKDHLYKKVFILPAWEEIYTTDEERKQTWEEALFTYESMRNTYLKYGYEVIEVPKIPVEERVQFILKNL